MELVTFCRWFTVRGKLHDALPGITALDGPCWPLVHFYPMPNHIHPAASPLWLLLPSLRSRIYHRRHYLRRTSNVRIPAKAIGEEQ